MFLLIILLLSGCRKSHPDMTTIKYEFTAGVPANYQLYYAVSNNSVAALIFNGGSWSQSLGVSKSSRPDTFSVARLTVYPPSDWSGTTNIAHINLRISINGDEKANVDTIMTGIDSSGITGLYAF